MKTFSIANRLLSGLRGKLDTALYNLLEILIELLKTSSTSNPGWRCTNTANIGTVNTIDKLLTFNSNVYDDGFHSTTGQISRATISKAGRYNIGANIEFDNNITGTRAVYFVLNNTTIIGAIEWGTALRMTLNIDYSFVVGDYIEVYAKQNSGGALNVMANTFSPSFWGHKI